MPSFGLLNESPPEPIREWGPSALGLTFAVGLTWLLSPELRLHTLSWFGLWALATQCTIPVLAATAAAVWAAARLLSRGSERQRIGTALDVACVATWLPPLFIFYREQSPWAVAIAAIMAAALTRAALTRSGPPERDAVRSLAPAVCAGMGFELAGAATSAGAWRICALALALAAGCLTWILTARSVWLHPALRRRKPRKFRVVPALLLGVSFSAGGLTPYLNHPRGPRSGGGGSDDARVLRVLFGGAPKAQAKANPMDGRPRGETRAIVEGESWPGVELWPDTQKYVTLVAPLPRAGLFTAKQLDTLSIPFYGAYWYFKGPGDPPANSFVTHGDPEKMSFRSTDFAPLTMEARQNFGRSIDLRCCSAIGVLIANGDKYFATVTMELEVRNSAIAGSPWLTLGEAPVSAALSQTLRFPIPGRMRSSQIDEVQVRFHLLQPRADRSARIAIRRFVFFR
ncbi:MAG TPA: hypothetical protein VFA04_27635 [Bryobacteraceae bacterium]|nr:hypothetical protein [Bryobacteraceae bacterium]